MAVGAAQMGHKAQQLALVELNRLGRSKVLRDDDKGFVALGNACVGACEDIHNAGGNILDVGGACLHIFVVHGREGFGKVLTCRLDGILGGFALRVDDFSDGIEVVVIVQHHHVDFKNRSVVLACLYDSLVVERLQLLNRLCLCARKAFQLNGRVGGCCDDFGLRLFQKLNFSDGDTLQNRFTCCNYHRAYLPL